MEVGRGRLQVVAGGRSRSRRQVAGGRGRWQGQVAGCRGRGQMAGAEADSRWQAVGAGCRWQGQMAGAGAVQADGYFEQACLSLPFKRLGNSLDTKVELCSADNGAAKLRPTSIIC